MARCRVYSSLIWMGSIIMVAACGPSSGPPSVKPTAPGPADTDGMSGEIARLEIARQDGVDRLVDLATPRTHAAATHAAAGDPGSDVRLRALRALARVATPRAIEVLQAALDDPDPRVRRQAARGLGIASGDDKNPAAESSLLALYRGSAGDPDTRSAVLMALGRLGGEPSLPVLAEALGDPELAEPASVALGRYGRRQIALDDRARSALIAAGLAALERPEATAIRFAVAFALSREHEPASPDADPRLVELLVALAGPSRSGEASDEASDEVRSMASRALARRDSGSAGTAAMIDALQARDWRVRVEAVRGLIRPGVSDEHLAAFAAILIREWSELGQRGWTSPHIHIIGEGLRALQTLQSSGPPTAPLHPVIEQVVDRLHRAAAENLRQPGTGALASSTVHCLAAALRARSASEDVRADRFEELLGCGQPAGGSANSGPLPEHERMALAARVAISFPDRGLQFLGQLAGHADSRVRAVPMQVLVPLTRAGRDGDPPRDREGARGASQAARVASEVRRMLAAGLADPAVEVAGGAVDALTQLARSDDERDQQLAREMSGNLVQAAGRHRPNLELQIQFFAALAATRATGGEALCRDAHDHHNRSIRAAARACLREYTGSDPGPGTAARPSQPSSDGPPVDPTSVIGKRVTLAITTTRGEIIVLMDPDAAPWHVASIVALVRDGFYRDLLWHRVVPNFVIQGGDPLGSGWGGPGFVIPAEPSSRRFVRGTVGIADAGLDTGGCQWFIMHSAAPHLDGRYTAIGQVVRGQDVVDQLIVGDRIRSATVTIE